MHIQHNVMQLSHANSAPACTRSRSPHNVLHSPSYKATKKWYGQNRTGRAGPASIVIDEYHFFSSWLIRFAGMHVYSAWYSFLFVIGSYIVHVSYTCH